MSFDRGKDALDLASEALFQALGDNAYELDRDFRFLTFNAGCVAYYGRPAEATLGQPIWEVLEGARGSWLEPLLREAMATRRPMRVEREGVARPDRWLEVTAFPTARGLGVAFRDRTTEHRATEALRQSEARQAFLLALEERLRGLADPDEAMAAAAEMLGRHLDAVRAGYAEVDAATGMLRVTRGWTEGRIPVRAGEQRALDAFGPAAAAELRTGRVLVVEDCLSDPRTTGEAVAATWAEIGVRALLVAPLVKAGTLNGFFYVHEMAPRRWSAAEAELVHEVAERTWAAVEWARAEAERRESEARLALAAEAAGLGIWDWDLVTNRFVYSPRAKAICGFDPEREPSYEDVRRATHPEDLPGTSAAARRALDPALRERPVFNYRLVRPDGSLRRVIAHGRALFERIGGEERAVRYVGTLQDVTEAWEAAEALRESEARLRLAVEAGQMAVWEYDVATEGVIGSPELNRLLGFPEDASPGIAEMRARYWPGEQERLQAIAQGALARGERHFEAEYRYLWPDGSVRWLMMRAEIRFGAGGVPSKVVGVVLDVSARKAAEERQVLLMREVDHRAKNALAVVQAAVRLTLAPDLESYRRAIAGRVSALARAQTLLAEDRWSGAELRALVEGELAAFVGERQRAVLEGPPVALPARAAQPLAMAIHELATNAVKYGALSVPSGCVAVRWSVERGATPVLTLRWAEMGGPPVATPLRRGFGSRVLEGTVRGQLAGAVTLAWEPGGLVCTLEVPLRREDEVESGPGAAEID
ncbi:HWE histidine kinase domain-containing protein [Belnapia sp. F-4-1]|uniref:HWE histidine kinase domain-containing protein n=1 Tax=Belnapia sp. F-4-1 TaxID=1545443 RepID=UPI000692199C|nr:HWE histidine kinase domain-containing protein [Belnapia sp. F-4-1]